MVPTRPVLRPPVTMHKFPASNLMESMILPVLMSNLKNIGEKQISFESIKKKNRQSTEYILIVTQYLLLRGELYGHGHRQKLP